MNTANGAITEELVPLRYNYEDVVCRPHIVLYAYMTSP